MNPFSNYYDFTATEYSAAIVLFNLLLAFALTLVIVYVYRKTRHGLSYSQSFVFTLVIMGVLGAAVMMIVQNNIVGAFALLGAFALIRFRTIIKETSDVAFIFFSLIIGAGVGLGHYTVVLILVPFLSVIVLLMNKYAFGSVSDNFDYLLIMRASKDFMLETVKTILDTHVAHRDLISTKALPDNSNEFVLSLKLRASSGAGALHEDLKKTGALESFELLTGRNTTEY